MSENKNQFKIAYNQNGIAVEAPNKQDCIDLFLESSKIKVNKPIDEAVR